MSTMFAVKGIMDRILKFLCIFFCGLMVILVTYQVLARFVLRDPSAVSEEAARICFVWMGLFASALLYGEKGHMNISFLPEKLGPVKGQYLVILSEICTFIMALWVLVMGGWVITENAMGQTNSAMTWLRVGVIYSVIPISGVFVVYYAICNIVQAVSKLRSAKNGTAN
ncbi:MAG: TRAP transporter small permease [Succinivibrio sp.]|jgi:TRAP-type C4-dicarboxylate transport system permease small subunit|nr:TRAP transporter small permease [Succinivibrio sp.]